MLRFAMGALALLLYICLVWYLRRRELGRLPPGPTPLPILGNLLNVSSQPLWKIHQHWKLLYGPIVHVRTFGRSTVILTEVDDAIALLEKRSMNYSDRVVTPMMELADWEAAFGFIHYGNPWKLRRKMFHQCFHPSATREHAPVQEKWAHRLVEWLRESPERFEDHCKRFVASTIVEITYGHEAESEHDQLIHSIEANLVDSMETVHFGKFLVDAIPILQRLPNWFPGTSEFRKVGAKAKEAVRNMVTIPFETTLSRVSLMREEKGNVAKLYSRLDPQDPHFEMQATALSESMGTAYIAGVETSVIALKNLLLLMTLHPDVQKRAREEIQQVIGHGRLPTVEDNPSFPYVEAMVKETLRILTILPEGIPHATIHADNYKGYDIPAQSMVMADAWNMLHDTKSYQDPFVFRPDRFLGPNPERDPGITGVFGFGRRTRICPGRHLAMSNVVLVAACILSQFELELALDENGQPIPVKIDQQPGMTSHPAPFNCSIRPLYA